MHGARRRWRLTLALAMSVLPACGGGSPATAPATSDGAAASTVTTRTTGTGGTVGTATTTVPGPSVTTTTAVVSSLPLGDGRLAAAPRAGSLFSCQTTFGAGPGAFRDGPWIKGDGTWDPTAKLQVEGSVAWPQADYAVRVEGDSRVITTNGVPGSATTGVFPIAVSDPAYQYDRNPNTITPRATTLNVPAEPEFSQGAGCVGMGMIGVLTDGVALYNALDAQGRDAAAHEVLDRCDGHPERTGQYHHHTVPACLLATTTAPSTLVGYALDGFGIYVERAADGRLLTNADLDECHGRTTPVSWNGRTVTMYHYVATLEYPYTVGCYRGTVVARR